jgi:hypothetical protein
MSKRIFRSKVKPIAASDAKANYDKLDAAIKDFSGDLTELESALGMYLLGRHFGWRPLVIIHNKRTIKKYEKILKIDIRTEFDAEGPDALRSNGYNAARLLSNFWKAVSGDTPVPERQMTT